MLTAACPLGKEGVCSKKIASTGRERRKKYFDSHTLDIAPKTLIIKGIDQK